MTFSFRSRLRYVTELLAEEGHTRLSIPTTIAPRYTPPEYLMGRDSDDDDRDREAAKKVAGVKYQMETPAPLTVRLVVRATSEILGVESPSHELTTGEVTKESASTYRCESTLAGTVSDMDRDFLDLVKARDVHRPRALCEEWQEKGTRAAMVSLVPSFRLKEHPVELVFLVDRSGSMGGSGITQAKKALQLFLHSLPAECLFNIYSFGSHHNSLFKSSVTYDDDSLAKAKSHVASMEADFGGTEIYAPLAKILKEPPREGFLRQVFVLTDGEVFNDQEVMSMIRKNNSHSRVFSLGLGDGCSRALVKGMARAGNGTAAFAADGEDLRPRVMAQLKDALQPAIDKVKVEWVGCGDGESDADLLEISKETEGEEGRSRLLLGPSPAKLPPVYDGSRLLAFR